MKTDSAQLQLTYTTAYQISDGGCQWFPMSRWTGTRTKRHQGEYQLSSVIIWEASLRDSCD